MKKILVAIVAVLFAAPSFAQYSSGGFSLRYASFLQTFLQQRDSKQINHSCRDSQ